MLFKNAKLGTKLFAGFFLILGMAVVLAFVGYYGLTGIVDRVNKSDDVNRLVKFILETRQAEKNFVLRGDEIYSQKVDENVKSLIDQATTTKEKFNQQINKDQMDQVIGKVTEYQKAFHTYVDIAGQKIATMETMRVSAREALAECEAIRTGQKNQLMEGLKKNSAFLDDKQSKSDDANRLIKWFLDTRKNEKEFIISGGAPEWAEKVNTRVDDTQSLAADLKSRFKLKLNHDRIDRVIAAINDYQTKFNKYTDVMQQRASTMDEMQSKARIAIKQAEEISIKQRQQLSVARKQANDAIMDKRTKTDDADRLIKYILKAEGCRMALMNDHSEKTLAKWKDINKKVFYLTGDLKSRFSDKKNQALADEALAAYRTYEGSMLNYLHTKDQRGKEKLVKAAQLALTKIEDIKADQKIELQELQDNVEVSLNEKRTKATDTEKLIIWFLDTQKNEKEFIMSNGNEEWLFNVEDSLEIMLGLSANLKSRFKQEVNLKQIDKVITAIHEYQGGFTKYADLMTQQAAAMNSMREKAQIALTECEGIRSDQKQQMAVARAENDDFLDDKLTKADDANRMIKWFIDGRKNEKEFIISNGEQKWMDKVDKDVASILDLGKNLKSRFKHKLNHEQIDKAMAAINAYVQAIHHFADLMNVQGEVEKVMVVAAREAQIVNADARADQKAKMKNQASRAQSLIEIVSVAAILLGILLTWIVTRAITKPLNRVIEGMTLASEQVSSAATQVSSSSQSLAEGASQQAASIEETSSSLEEMASITRENAENANVAQARMTEAEQIVQKVNHHMNDMSEAINEITKTSEETGKIIKTIDEIAFQTNLLALNAAVEAARAGEAGAGFAVVADEVRNLAMRAAEAAKNTSGLIENTIKAVQNGSELTQSTQEAFQQNMEVAEQTAKLVGKIAAASNEQSQGIEQVNKAVTEMDIITQQNASTAEESASASEEMNAQAVQMQTMIGELAQLIGGKNSTSKGPSNAVKPAGSNWSPEEAAEDSYQEPVDYGQNNLSRIQ